MLINTIFKFLNKINFLYFLKIFLFDKNYNRNKKKMKYSQKTLEQIKKEMAFIKSYWKCTPVHYVRYGLFDKKVTNEELLDYIPSYYMYNYYFPYIYRNVILSIYDNKLNIFRLFKEKEIPTPEIIAIFKSKCLFDINMVKITIYDVLKDITNGDKLFFKPISGQGGVGIVVLMKENNTFYSGQKKIHPENILDLLNSKKEYVIQKCITQREDISNINKKSVNTIRAITQLIDGEFILSVCVMRIGRGESYLDNSHLGGISIQIDVNSGQFFKYATAEIDDNKYYYHPDTNFEFSGFKIFDWENIKTSIISFASKFPELKDIAWDIAITDFGIEAIEINVGYGIAHLQSCCGGMRRCLHIYPDEI